MGVTKNLQLATISEADNMLVKKFFQDLAGDVTTSNMQKIDAAHGEIVAQLGETNREVADNKATIQSVALSLDDFLPKGADLDLIKDGVNRFAVTLSEKTKWNNKSDFSGSYKDLTNKPTQDDILDGAVYKRVTNEEKKKWNTSPSASDITAGTFSGIMKAGAGFQAPGQMLIRNCRFAPESESTSTLPQNEGEIVFYYEDV